MQYLSPSTFSGETASAPLDKKAIQLGRKKLFAELELSGGSTIELHGKPFTKNDIIKYFEDLLKEDALTYHNAVGEDRVLLGFLEHAQIGRKETFLNNPLYKDEPFIQWISPYFRNSFTTFLNGCFLEPDEDGLTSLLNSKLLMTPADLEQSWEAVSRIVMTGISTLERFDAQNGRKNAPGDVTPTQVKNLMEFRYIRMIQMLPQTRFASLRDKYALCMHIACIGIFNKYVQHRAYVKTWMENAELLAVSQDVKNVITQKLEEMNAIYTPEPGNINSGSSSSSVPWKIILFALIIVIRIATCKSHSSSSNYNNYNYQHTPVFPQNSSQKELLESVLKKYRDTPDSASRKEFLDSLLKKYRDRNNQEVEVEPARAMGSMDTVTVTHKIRRKK